MNYAKLKPFLNDQGQLTQWPAKRKISLLALFYIAEKVPFGQIFTEKQFNEIMDKWHTFDAAATLRRELFELKIVDRERDGSNYRKREIQPDPAKYGLLED